MPHRMKSAGWILGAVAGVLAGSTHALAQQDMRKAAAPVSRDAAPVIKSLFPPGATVDKTTEWKVTGANLDKVESWLVSGTGVELAEMQREGSGKLTVVVRVAGDAEPGMRELRAAGPEGISNLVLFRVDHLPQTSEAEPNDVPEKANPITPGSAVAGVLKPLDVDYFRVDGRAGQRFVVDLEARRLGVALSPVVTVFSTSGAALAQGREHPGAGQDARFEFVPPADGAYLIQVRDNAYSGGDTAAYRLRLDTARFATGLFPLGGPKGQSITVTASGGDLPAPVTKTVTLPAEPGSTIDVGPFDSPGGAVLAPAKLVVGDGPEINEAPAGPNGPATTPLPLGTTANGRIERPGEVDRYTIQTKKGEPIHIRIVAAPLGSWLDSVVAVRDATGKSLAENDDPGNNNAPRRAGIIFGLAETTPDSRLDFEPKADGELTLEVTDRYGGGGPEYAYRLEVAAAKPDFSISLLLVNPNANRGRVVVDGANMAPQTPGSTGAFNLKPGARLPLNFLITPEAFAGSIEVRAEGLPPGVSAAPVPIRMPSRVSQPVGGSLELKADPDAEPGVAEFRLVATGKTAQGDQVIRTATALVAFDPLTANNPTPFGARSITRTVSSVPVAVTQAPRAQKPKIMGPPKPVALLLKDISAAGPLLQGGRIELALTLDPPNPDADSFRLEAEVKGKGLLTQTVVANDDASSGEGVESGAIVRVMAAVDAKLGPNTLNVTFTPLGGKVVVKQVPIEVRAPASLTVPQEPIQLVPGGSATFRVGVKREAGFDSPVELKVEELPKGVKVAGPLRIARDQDGLDVRLEMATEAAPVGEPVPFRVICMARMPRGPVRVDSANRPMVCSRLAEK